MGKLKGKKALITAGAQGIGKAVTEELAAGGCDVFVHYFSSKLDFEETRALAPDPAKIRIATSQADLRSEEEAN